MCKAVFTKALLCGVCGEAFTVSWDAARWDPDEKTLFDAIAVHKEHCKGSPYQNGAPACTFWPSPENPMDV